MKKKEYPLEPDPREVVAKSPSDEIYLTVIVGNEQIGGTYVKHNNKTIAKGALQTPTFLGSFENIADSKLLVTTNVLDVNPSLDRCVVTTTFTNQNGHTLFTKIDKGEAPTDGLARFIGNYMLRLPLLLVLAAFLSPLIATSQDNTPSFKSLEVPTSPGFILLDETPASVEKPTTPQGLGLSLIGLASDGGGALNISPFWLYDHPNRTAEDRTNEKSPIYSQLTVSLATANSDSGNYLSGGVRTRLYQDYGRKIRDSLSNKKQQIVQALAEDTLDLRKISKLRQEYVNLTEKPLFTIDLAGALAGRLVEERYQDISLNRWAVWLSFNYRPGGDDFYATALTRYMRNDNFEEYVNTADMFDMGVRLNYDINRLTVSGEFLQRVDLTQSLYDDVRYAFIAGYELFDNVFITGSVGENFGNVNKLFTLVGINIGYSTSKVNAF